MISRCPSCGAPAPDEARQCQGCGWDFVANKMGDKKAAAPPKIPPKPAVPPAAGLALPPARGGAVSPSSPAVPPKPKIDAASPAADENPFALPVARNLGPKPGESLFSPPPPAPEAKLPEAKPKPAPEPETALPAAKPKHIVEPEPEAQTPDEEPPPPKKTAPPPEEPPRKSEAPKRPPEPIAEEAEDVAPAALFLPSSTKEIFVEPAAKRAKAEPPAPEKAPVAGKGTPAADDDEVAKPKTGRPSAVYLAALAGAALGLFSVGAIFMMLRSEPPAAAPSTRSSPFGKRAAGEATMTPVLDEVDPRLDVLEAPAPPPSPAPVAVSNAPSPTSLPAPAVSRAVEPPSPGRPEAAPAPAPVTAAPAPAPPPRPTATFPKLDRPAPAAPPVAAPKPKAPAPRKAAGPQWVFEGTVYDLLTTRGAYGVRLVFVDAEDNEVASVETAEDGRYRAAMKPGPAEGYSLRILHDDYSGKHIDELDSTSSVRKADLEQRKFLMQAGARSLPWIGAVGAPVRRDMALVPKVSAE